MIFALIVSLPFVYILARRPVLRRLAIRNATRRPRESLLVIAGSMLATALMTASFVVGDTLDSSMRAFAYTKLGPTDEVVSVVGLDQEPALRAALDGFTDPDVDGVLPITTAGIAAATLDSPTQARTAAPKGQLAEIDFAAARDFGGDPDATGISGATPAEGRAVIVDDLARKLRIDTGDTFTVFAYGASRELVVDRVVAQEGLAGFWLGRESSSYNAFVAPGTIASLFAAATEPGEPPTFSYLVSNTGGVETGAERTDAVETALEEAIGDQTASVNTVKADLLDEAATTGETLTQLYQGIGMFAVFAGILLLINIFRMLAEERQSELGMLRAMGLRRRALVATFASEGWLYAIVACTVGVVLGLGVGRLVTAGAARILSGGEEEFSLPIRFAVDAASIQAGFTIGLVIAVITVLFTSVAISRFNIIAAIRGFERIRKRPGTLAGVAWSAVVAIGLLMTLGGIAGPRAELLLLGPAVAATGLARLAMRGSPSRPIVTIAGVLVLAWGVAAVSVATDLGADLEITAFFVQGLVLTISAVVLVSEYQAEIGHALARITGNALSVRLGLAYPLARKSRTALTLAQFSIVVFVLVYISVMAQMFRGQVDGLVTDVSGGYSVLVDSNPANPVPPAELATVDGVQHVAPLVRQIADITPHDAAEATTWSMTAFDRSFVEVAPPALEDRGAYPSDLAAYRAVLDDPSLAIVDSFFLSVGAGPPSAAVKIGETITVADPASGRSKELTVVAEGPADWVFNGGLMSASAAREIFGERAVANRVYVSTTDGPAVAATVESRWFDRGAEADTLRNIIDENLTQQTQFFTLMRAFLAVGLVIGVAGIGVIMVRAVRERKRQVGVLRALGFQSGSVSNAFAIEASFLAVIGVAIGVALGFVCTWSITTSDDFGEGLSWSVPWVAVAVLVAGTLVGALLATLGPARSASRIKPAVALRTTD